MQHLLQNSIRIAMPDHQAAISFRDLHKSYGSLDVLRGMTGQIKAGEVVAIIGASGCGKSTLLRCFNRLETINSGELIVNGMDLSNPDLTRKQLQRLRAQVGMVFQQFNLFPHMTVLDNLTLAPQKVLSQKKQDCRELASHFLVKVGLTEKGDAYPEQLSGGQKQRVAIARALCMQPDIMLFDEPTSALDPELVGEVLEVMKQLAEEGMTMIIVTHEIQFARDVANRVIFLNKGLIEEDGEAYQVITKPQSDRLQSFLSRMQLAGVA